MKMKKTSTSNLLQKMQEESLCKKQGLNLKEQKGITLIALVVTIVVLLILAGVTITFVLGEGGILDMAKEAADKTNQAIANEQSDIAELTNQLANILGGDSGSSSGGGEETPPSPEPKLQTDGSFDGKVNSPKLKTGMRAITWNKDYENEDGSKGAWLEPKTNEEWYNYEQKKWANAITEDGSMWVWIPRYAYQIESGYHSNIVGKINIDFLKGKSYESATDSNKTKKEDWNNKSGQGNWNVHPAFTDDIAIGGWNTEISGIWVAKFEASRLDAGFNEDKSIKEGVSNTLKIIQDVTSWRNVNNNEMYLACLNYNTALNSHLMKNSEWGAVAYLTQSIYGKNSEVGVNQCSSYLTGMGPTDNNDVSGDSGYEYNNEGIDEFSKAHGYLSEQGKKASTTGNETGIYDMSGGVWERVAAYVDTGHSNLMEYGESIVLGESYMKNVYKSISSTEEESSITSNQGEDYEANKEIYGDAVYEISDKTVKPWKDSWYGDYSNFPYSNVMFFGRGGYHKDKSMCGIFSFYEGPRLRKCWCWFQTCAHY